MKGSFAISLLFGAAIGLFGLAVFHDAGPVTRAVSDGYGIAYATIAAADTSTAQARK
jgi:hypothetical protein